MMIAVFVCVCVCVCHVQGREIATLEPNSLRNHDLAVSPDGRFVAVASFTAEVKIWELRWAKDTGEFKGRTARSTQQVHMTYTQSSCPPVKQCCVCM
jgi:hypothetical protein